MMYNLVYPVCLFMYLGGPLQRIACHRLQPVHYASGWYKTCYDMCGISGGSDSLQGGVEGGCNAKNLRVARGLDDANTRFVRAFAFRRFVIGSQQVPPVRRVRGPRIGSQTSICGQSADARTPLSDSTPA
jgi:hypothetical protein